MPRAFDSGSLNLDYNPLNGILQWDIGKSNPAELIAEIAQGFLDALIYDIKMLTGIDLEHFTTFLGDVLSSLTNDLIGAIDLEGFMSGLSGWVEGIPIIGDIVQAITGIVNGDLDDLGVLKTVVQKFTTLGEDLNTFLAFFFDLVNDFLLVGAELRTNFVVALRKIGMVVSDGRDGNQMAVWLDVFAEVITFFQTISQQTRAAWLAALKDTVDWFNGIVDRQEWLAKLTETVNWFMGLGEDAVDTIASLTSWFSGLGSGAVTALGDFLNWFSQLIFPEGVTRANWLAALKAFIDWFSGVGNQSNWLAALKVFIDWFVGIATNIRSAWLTALNQWVDWFRQIIFPDEAARANWLAALKAFIDWFVGIATNIRSAWLDALKVFIDWFVGIATNIQSAWLDALKAFIDWFRLLAFPSGFNRANWLDALGKIINAVVAFVNSGTKMGIDKFIKFLTDIIDFFSKNNGINFLAGFSVGGASLLDQLAIAITGKPVNENGGGIKVLSDWSKDVMGLGTFVATVTGDSSDKPALQKLAEWARDLVRSSFGVPASLLYGQLPAQVLGIVPVSNIGVTSPNLLSQSVFATQASIEVANGWAYDPSQSQSSGSGSARFTGSGTNLTRELYANQIIPVAENNQMAITCWVRASGPDSTGRSMRLCVVPFIGSVRQSTIVLATQTGVPATWTKIGRDVGNTWVVPAGVTSIRIMLEATAPANSYCWFDTVEVFKTGLIEQTWLDQVLEAFKGLWEGQGGSAQGTATFSKATNTNMFQRSSSLQSTASTAYGTAVYAAADSQEIIDGVNQTFGGSFSSGASRGTVKTNFQNFHLGLYGQTRPAATILSGTVPSLDASKIGSGEFDSPRLKAGAVTNEKIGSLAVANGNIQDLAVTGAKTTSLDGSKIASGSVAATYVGALPADKITSGEFGSARLAASSVTNAKLAALSVANGNIQDLAVTGAKTTSLDGSKIASGSVAATYVGALPADKITSGEFGSARLAASAVTEAKLATDAVTTAKIAASAVTTTELGASAVTNAKLAALAVANGNIQDLAVTGSKTTSLDGSKIASGVVNVAYLPVNSIGQQLTTAGSGAQMTRRSAANVNVVSGRVKVPTGFYTSLDRSSADITSNLSAGRFTVSLAGWYLAEIGYKLNPSVTIFGFSLVPILMRGLSGSATSSAYRTGTEGSSASPATRFVQNSWIVYLNAGDFVEAGYEATGMTNGLLDADANGVETYFSIALLNRSYN